MAQRISIFIGYLRLKGLTYLVPFILFPESDMPVIAESLPKLADDHAPTLGHDRNEKVAYEFPDDYKIPEEFEIDDEKQPNRKPIELQECAKELFEESLRDALADIQASRK